jgi:hypothetical protein
MTHLSESGFVEGHVLAAHQRHETLAFGVGRDWQADQLAERRIDIEELSEFRDAVASVETGCGDDERCAGGVRPGGFFLLLPRRIGPRRR